MERMSAEGKFFHRQCFRCSVCKCNLLLGNYVFDNFESNDGRFYCKLHYNRMVYATPKANSPESKQGNHFSSIPIQFCLIETGGVFCRKVKSITFCRITLCFISRDPQGVCVPMFSLKSSKIFCPPASNLPPQLLKSSALIASSLKKLLTFKYSQK